MLVGVGRVLVNAPIRRFSGGRFVSRPDTVAGEEPLQILLRGRPYTVTMRTPGDDLDLVNGLLHAEGLISTRTDIRAARYCAGQADESDTPGNTYNVIDVDLEGADQALIEATTRTASATSACGVCGTASIDALQLRSRHRLSPDGPVFEPDVVLSFQRSLRQRQRVFARTGGIHAAALGSADGALTHVREDVGRHNAVDKVIGALLRDDALPASDGVLVTSSRASFELVAKAVLAGIPMLVAASAPSSLAVQAATEAGLTLVGFAREDSFNVYSAAHRVSGAG
jgi:FdhD protein